MTATTGAPTGADYPVGYVFLAQGTQHVVYVGRDSHIHELWWDSAGWHHHDLTPATGASALYVYFGYTFEAQGTQHILYGTGHGDIRELWWDNNGWHYEDLGSAADAPSTGSFVTAYMFNTQRTQHVVYIQNYDSNNQNGQRVCELYWAPYPIPPPLPVDPPIAERL